MSSANYTVKLTADTSQHDKALGKSKQQVYNYQKGVEKSKQELDKFTSKVQGGAVSALSKFAVGIGAGVGALETFDKIIKSSQTTSDAWDGVIRGCTNTVNTFFTALATGDFTNFNQGLDVLIAKGKKAKQALDQLGNTQISYGYFTSKNRTEFSEALTRAKDKSLTQSERDSAVSEAKEILKNQELNVQSLIDELENTISALGTESNRLSDMTVERLEKVLSYDTLPKDIRKQVKERLEAEYKIYEEEIAKLDRAINRKQTYTGYISRTGEKTVLYDMKLKELNEQYQDAIDYKTWLANKDDEQLINATSLLIKIQETNKALDEMKRQLLEITNQTVTTPLDKPSNSTIKPTVAVEIKVKPEEGSISDLQNRLKEINDELINTNVSDERLQELTLERVSIEQQIEALKVRNGLLEKKPETALIEGSLAYIEDKLNEINNLLTNTNVSDEALQGLLEQKKVLEEQVEALKIRNGLLSVAPEQEETINNLRNLKDEAYEVSSAIGTIGNTFTAIGSACGDSANQALQITGAITNAVAQMIPQVLALASAEQANAFASGIASASKVEPFPAKFGAIASIVATLAATFAQVKSIAGFANGGIFTGNSTIGDLNLAKVNKGEMILNGSQQARLFRMLNSGNNSSNNSGGNVEFILRGDTLIGLMKNTEKKNRRII